MNTFNTPYFQSRAVDTSKTSQVLQASQQSQIIDESGKEIFQIQVLSIDKGELFINLRGDSNFYLGQGNLLNASNFKY